MGELALLITMVVIIYAIIIGLIVNGRSFIKKFNKI